MRRWGLASNTEMISLQSYDSVSFLSKESGDKEFSLIVITGALSSSSLEAASVLWLFVFTVPTQRISGFSQVYYNFNVLSNPFHKWPVDRIVFLLVHRPWLCLSWFFGSTQNCKMCPAALVLNTKLGKMFPVYEASFFDLALSGCFGEMATCLTKHSVPRSAAVKPWESLIQPGRKSFACCNGDWERAVFGLGRRSVYSGQVLYVLCC